MKNISDRVPNSSYHIEANTVVGYKGTALWTMAERAKAEHLCQHLRDREWVIEGLKITNKALTEENRSLQCSIEEGEEMAEEYNQQELSALKQEVAVLKHKADAILDAAYRLAELADKAFYYSRESRADADQLIKVIRCINAEAKPELGLLTPKQIFEQMAKRFGSTQTWEEYVKQRQEEANNA